MIDKLKQILDITFWKFIIVGIINTIFGTAIMFIFYNGLHLNYWISSVSNYILGSVLSYFLNKHFTFKNRSKNKKVLVRFVINISMCYLMAYGVARPIVRMMFQGYETKIQDNLAMLAGMCIFVILNYLGQRFWTFRENSL